MQEAPTKFGTNPPHAGHQITYAFDIAHNEGEPSTNGGRDQRCDRAYTVSRCA